MTKTHFGEADHELFQDQGYVRLGQVASDEDLRALQLRIDGIMLGRVRYEHMRLQLFDETTGQLRRTMGNEVSSLSYRRIDDLEQDPHFLKYLQQPLFESICRRYVGDRVSVFRSMFMNKPAHWTQELPWHQDVGSGWGIDSNPVVAVWTALDAATRENGAVQVVPGSHRDGVINERHFLSEEQWTVLTQEADVVDLEVAAGEVILLHNLLVHRSGTNPTSSPRRAFSVTYMDAETRTLDTGQTFPVVFGQGALEPASVAGKEAELVRTFYG
jgi:hypothetical protein